METKNCNNISCKQVNPQPIDNFSIENDGKYNWRRSKCKSCRNEKNKKYRYQNQEKYNAYMREYNAQNKGTRKWKDRYKNKVLVSRYGITLEKYNEMYESQNKCCQLCGKGPTRDNALCVDHHHVTGKVRALLCHGCNRDIAILDNPEKLEKAKLYLAQYAN